MTNITDQIAKQAVEVQSAPAEEAQSKLTEMCQRLVVADDYIKKLEAKLKEAKGKRATLAGIEIPEYADSIGQDVIGLPDDNADVTIQTWYKAGIPAADPADKELTERRRRAFSWLVEEGHGDLIKTTIEISFGRKEVKEARKLMDELEKRGFTASSKMGVHWRTLTSFVKEQIEDEDANPVPMDLLGATLGRIAKLKKRK